MADAKKDKVVETVKCDGCGVPVAKVTLKGGLCEGCRTCKVEEKKNKR